MKKLFHDPGINVIHHERARQRQKYEKRVVCSTNAVKVNCTNSECVHHESHYQLTGCGQRFCRQVIGRCRCIETSAAKHLQEAQRANI